MDRLGDASDQENREDSKLKTDVGTLVRIDFPRKMKMVSRGDYFMLKLSAVFRFPQLFRKANSEFHKNK